MRTPNGTLELPCSPGSQPAGRQPWHVWHGLGLTHSHYLTGSPSCRSALAAGQFADPWGRREGGGVRGQGVSGAAGFTLVFLSHCHPRKPTGKTHLGWHWAGSVHSGLNGRATGDDLDGGLAFWFSPPLERSWAQGRPADWACGTAAAGTAGLPEKNDRAADARVAEFGMAAPVHVQLLRWHGYVP